MRITEQHSKQDRSEETTQLQNILSIVRQKLNDLSLFGKLAALVFFINGFSVTSPVQFIVYVNSQVFVVHNCVHIDPLKWK